MHESPTQPTGPESVTPAANLPRLREPAAPVSTAAQTSAPVKRQMFSRVVLPLFLFVAMVAGIAWVTQYIPWRGVSRKDSTVKSEPPACIKFDNEDANRLVRAVWNLQDSPYVRGSILLKAAEGKLTPTEKETFLNFLPEVIGEKQRDKLDDAELKALAEDGMSQYLREFETMQSGSYAFPFANVTNGEVEMGLKSVSCQCSGVEVCLLTPEQFEAIQKAKAGPGEVNLPGLDWKELKENDKQGIDVPPQARGLARIAWKKREQQLERLTITVQLWSQPKGDPAARSKIMGLQTSVRIVAPVEADGLEIKFRPVEARSSSTASFWCWSATRPDAKKLRVIAEKEDPNFTFQVTRADEAQRVALQDRLWGKYHTLMKTAWLVEVTAHEERNGKQMDMGAFARRLSLYLDDENEAYIGPIAKGMVSSDVQVGSGVGMTEGKIDLGVIDVRKGFHKHRSDPIKLRTDLGATLKYVPEETFPTFLKVTLTPNAKESKSRAVWNLQIDIPGRDQGNDFTGTLPENSAIVLLRELKGSPPRRIRILVEGTAGLLSAGANPR
jgi:hypothetical protein